MQSARRLTGLSSVTLRRWTDKGALPDRRSAGGHRVFLVSDLEAAVGGPLVRRPQTGTTLVAYARVSSRRQASEGDLERQVGRLEGWAGAKRPGLALEVYRDVASGLSERRAGLRRALQRAQSPEVSELVVSHRERLARFGTGWIEMLLCGYGVSLVCIGEDEALSGSAEPELVRDMLAVVTSLSGRLYGQRSAKARALQACVRAGAR